MAINGTHFLAVLLLFTFANIAEITFDFGKNKDGNDWEIINDGVMGGLSKGEFEFTDHTLKFYGSVSLDNYGGFTSIKSPFKTFDLGLAQKVKIRYKTSNQSIAINLENSKEFYKPYYKLNLEDTNDEWKSVEIEINQFKGYSLGQEVSTKISKEFLKSVQRIGFITSQKKEGKFNIEVDYLKFE
ncbi:MAG: CIA30 family protein [Bacteroidota bacterium]